MAREVRAGLLQPLPELPSKYFYDDRGSRLFEEITRLPEYYPTRTEIGDPRARRARRRGPGPSPRARRARVGLRPQDPSPPRRRAAAGHEAPRLLRHQRGVRARLARPPACRLPGARGTRDRRRLLARPRSPRPGRGTAASLPGRDDRQLPPRRRPVVLRGRGGAARPRGLLPGGIRPREGRAAAGSGLQRLAGRHRGVQPEHPSRDEPRGSARASCRTPRSTWPSSIASARGSRCGCGLRRPRRCECRGRGSCAQFARGAEIRTEISCKYTRESIEALLGGSGLVIERWFTDAESLFALALLRRESGS